MDSKSRSFVFTRPSYVSVNFNLIMPCRPFETAYVSRGWTVSHSRLWSTLYLTNGSALRLGPRVTQPVVDLYRPSDSTTRE